MKIFLLTTEYPPFFGGGIATYCKNTAEMLIKRGHKVIVVFPDNINVKNEKSKENGVNIVRFSVDNYCDFNLGGSTRVSFAFSRVIEDVIDDFGMPDIIEAQEYNAIAYFLLKDKLTFVNKKLINIPIIITAHTPTFCLNDVNHLPSYKLPEYWVGQMEKFCLRAADGLIFPSQFLKDEIKKQCDITDNNKVIFNPFSLKENSNDNSVREYYDFVFFSKIQLRKGILWLLKELKIRWDNGSTETLVIYGGPSIYEAKNCSMSEYIMRQYSHYISKGLITIKGLRPLKDIEMIMQNAKIVFNPTLFENFPYVTLETLSLGCITLSSKNGGQKEIIRDKINGFLFDIDKVETFHEAVNYILKLSNDERNNIKDNAQKTVNSTDFFDKIYDNKNNFLQHTIENNKNVNNNTYPVLKYTHNIKKSTVISENTLIKKGVLSIVIPYYNSGKYIEETLKSIANISYKNVEIIVVDDGSDKNNSLIINNLVKKYSFQIKSKNNGGLSSARNHGAKNASGEFITFLDADDTVTVGYYKHAIDVLNKYKNISFVGSFVKYFGDSHERWVTWDPEFPYMLTSNMLNAGSVYRRKDFLIGGLNDIDMEYGMEDYNSLISMMECGYYGIVLPTIGYNYRIHKNSMSRGFNYTNKQYLYELIASKHMDIFKHYSVDIIGILNDNGPGYLYDNPTYKTFCFEVIDKYNNVNKYSHLNKDKFIFGLRINSIQDVKRLSIKAKKKIFPHKWI